MVIREFGQKNKKVLLFFPGSCEPWQEFAYAARELAVQYHVLLVTPDGHDPEEGTDFISVEKTVDDTVCWVKEHGITRLDALYGLSFGGGMAVRFLTTQDILVRRVIIDAGTAPYQLPKWICRLICLDCWTERLYWSLPTGCAPWRPPTRSSFYRMVRLPRRAAPPNCLQKRMASSDV